MHCTSCGKALAPGTRFCPGCGAAVGAAASDAGAGSSVPPPPPAYGVPGVNRAMPLLRPREGRVIAGVCAAFAVHFGWDVILVRVLVGVLTFVTGFVVGIVSYLVAWLIIPDAPYALSAQSR